MLVSLLAKQLHRMNQLLSEAFYESAKRRVLRRLLELDDAGGSRRGDPDHAGAAGRPRRRVTLDRRRGAGGEQRRGAIEIRRGATVVRDPAAVARRAGLPVRAA